MPRHNFHAMTDSDDFDLEGLNIDQLKIDDLDEPTRERYDTMSENLEEYTNKHSSEYSSEYSSEISAELMQSYDATDAKGIRAALSRFSQWLFGDGGDTYYEETAAEGFIAKCGAFVGGVVSRISRSLKRHVADESLYDTDYDAQESEPYIISDEEDDGAYENIHIQPEDEQTDDDVTQQETNEYAVSASVKIERTRQRSVRLRRAVNVHSPYAFKPPKRASEVTVLETSENTIKWNKSQGSLIITERDHADEFGGVIKGGVVEVNVAMLDAKAVPLIRGVIASIDLSIDKFDVTARQCDDDAPWWVKDPPYMIESGQNTFIWYRTSRRLQVSREKAVDDRGVLTSVNHVHLCLDCLSEDEAASLKGIFGEMLQRMRG